MDEVILFFSIVVFQALCVNKSITYDATNQHNKSPVSMEHVLSNNSFYDW